MEEGTREYSGHTRRSSSQGRQWIVPLVARYADGWNAVSGVTPDGIRERKRIIEDECRRIGRSPCPSTISVLLPLVAITNVPPAGPVVRLGARLVAGKAVARSVLADAGATEIVLGLVRRSTAPCSNGLRQISCRLFVEPR